MSKRRGAGDINMCLYTILIVVVVVVVFLVKNLRQTERFNTRGVRQGIIRVVDKDKTLPISRNLQEQILSQQKLNTEKLTKLEENFNSIVNTVQKNVLDRDTMREDILTNSRNIEKNTQSISDNKERINDDLYSVAGRLTELSNMITKK